MTAWRNYYRASGSKYNNKKVEFEGITFDSIKEGRRYLELKLLERAGEISNLERQVKFVLIPAQREPDTIGARGGIKKGKLLEREAAYIADFVYTDREGRQVVEDTKGVKTPEYILKRKLMLEKYGIKIREL